jgi:DNA-binding response OmpR family regulator
MPTSPRAYKTIAQANAKVLVIDDDPSIRELLRLHLANGGYEVLVAEDAIVGGRLALENSPELIIVDVNMPYLDGPDFVIALRADPQTKAIPVIFLTVDEDIAHRVGHLCAINFLKKPVMADRLLKLVAEAI